MPMLKKGLAGAPVKILQRKLGVDVDGQFGPATDKALRAYQKANGLSVDGIAGPDTFAEMGLYELVLVKRGSRGSTVKAVQKALGTGADGIFGPGTEKAVKAFQKDNGLAVDGLVGPATLSALGVFSDITEEAIKVSRAEPEEVAVVAEAVADGAEAAPTEEAVEVAEASAAGGIWGKMKSWFN